MTIRSQFYVLEKIMADISPLLQLHLHANGRVSGVAFSANLLDTTRHAQPSSRIPNTQEQRLETFTRPSRLALAD
jgi:hypothetical protein